MEKSPGVTQWNYPPSLGRNYTHTEVENRIGQPTYDYLKFIRDVDVVASSPWIRPCLVPCDYLVDDVSEDVQRSWRERLFSWPWRPLQKTKTITKKMPSNKMLIVGNTLYAHPGLISKMDALRTAAA